MSKKPRRSAKDAGEAADTARPPDPEALERLRGRLTERHGAPPQGDLPGEVSLQTCAHHTVGGVRPGPSEGFTFIVVGAGLDAYQALETAALSPFFPPGKADPAFAPAARESPRETQRWAVEVKPWSPPEAAGAAADPPRVGDVPAPGPGPDDLVDAGDIDEPVPHGQFLELAGLAATLKARRERLGLSLADVAHRSGLTRAAVSRLENGWNTNPTLETLYRYALALDAHVRLTVEDADAGDDDP